MAKSHAQWEKVVGSEGLPMATGPSKPFLVKVTNRHEKAIGNIDNFTISEAVCNDQDGLVTARTVCIVRHLSTIKPSIMISKYRRLSHW